jgi:aspartate racemase
MKPLTGANAMRSVLLAILGNGWTYQRPQLAQGVGVEMKAIGLLGGMSWESTAEYYRLINEGVKSRLGGLHSARIVMYSVDFEPVERLQRAGDWTAAAAAMIDGARRIERGGADFLVICTNTMHKLAPQVEAAISIPLLHIADAAAQIMHAARVARAGLLGTRFTMEEDFYKGRLAERHGIEVVVPETGDRQLVDRVIYEELCLGEIRDRSRREFTRIIADLAGRGAQGVALACTEIPLLVKQRDSPLPIFDTTAIHAAAAVTTALENR